MTARSLDKELDVPRLPGAACHNQPALLALFFSDDADDQEAARGVCAGCPVRHECYWGAIERREPHGIWGGSCFPDEWRQGMRRLARLREELDDLDAAVEPVEGAVPPLRSA